MYGPETSISAHSMFECFPSKFTSYLTQGVDTDKEVDGLVDLWRII